MLKVRSKKMMEERKEEFMEIFKRFHQYPELSFKEFETTKYIKTELEKLGIEILDYGLETGVIGLLKGKCEGPCIGLRADIDALPVLEQASCDYRSKNVGVMHACGHDSHASSLLCAAHILSALRDEICGSVKFLFQPAEEINMGAKLLVKQGCLENPHVDAIFGMHNSPEVPAGSVAVKNGPLMAAVDRINITIKGKGGHGGVPQRNVDPIVAAAAVIQSLQTIVSRNVSPLDSCVVSVCNIKAGEGTTNNVTPDEVKMYGTVRSYKKDVEKMLETRIKEIVSNVSAAYGCVGETEYIYELAVTDNCEQMYQIALAAVKAIGVDAFDPIPSTGGEDFSEYTEYGIHGFMYWLGTRNEEKDCVYSWHSPKFKFDPECIPIGAGTYAMSVFEAINALK
ncbi:amidohydrolase [Anaerotignum lactatifermentans]|uniref:Amidohydrolase n=1 Tax=Anaerotignum lactatifermentans TaxID=160404 RepID=A0ABS2G6B2_9FIRM|nr:M20 family metallopeptidase [Anaerotignum lactatifermentans]MBM6828858.1 amidohydrolase [Anaerotignum lactatifermentans]MBM6876969.1 amidohydrolase [Anaerotignum lactatifermentans]MBM6950527.1 amidohydrolase [Anaerotignum lactatifermentans]